MIRIAREAYPDLEFIEADVEDQAALGSLKCTFDYILLSDTIGSLDDCQRTLALLHRVCRRDTRVVISYYSYLWEPVLKLAESTGMKMKQVDQNYLTTNDLVNFLQLADFDVIARDWRQLVPVSLWGLGRLVNRYLATLPLLRRLCLRHYVVGRSMLHARPGSGRCSVIVPCRNERGNIEAAVTRLHGLGPETEMAATVRRPSVTGTATQRTPTSSSPSSTAKPSSRVLARTSRKSGSCDCTLSARSWP